MTAKILLVADDIKMLRFLRGNLLDRGYEVSFALDGHKALQITSSEDPDLIILSLNFSASDANGIKLCRDIREISRCPIIVLSLTGTKSDKILALDMGADDCLDLPFTIEEFMAHVRSALRRWMNYAATTPRRGHLIFCGDLIINKSAREVMLQGKHVKLTYTEFNLLKYLAEHNGNVVTHSELLREIWGPEFNAQRECLRVYISQLRHKIESNPLTPNHILTEPGVGYRFRIGSI